MRGQIHYFVVLIVPIVLFAVVPSLADDLSTVSAQGMAVKQVAPTLVRVRFRVVATGKTVKSAMSKLDANRKALQTRLDAVKNGKPEVHFGDMIQQPESGQPFQQRIMAMAMAGGQKKDEGDQKRTQRLALEVSLTWPMKTASAAERLLQIDAIEQQLRELELIDRDEAARDEGAENEDDKKPGDDAKSDAKSDAKEDAKTEAKSHLQFDARPTYDFIYQATDAEWAELHKAAFADARKKAEDLASAAGRKLGALRSLSDYGSSAESMSSIMDKTQANMADMFGEGKSKFMDDFPPEPQRATSDQFRPMQIRREINAVVVLD